MEDSILKTIKKMLGVDPNKTSPFDTDIMLDINTTFSILSQLGVGPSAGFKITGDTETWSFYTNDDVKLEMVKTYVFMKVKLMFDPPLSSAVTEVYNKQIAELEWRLNVQVDPGQQEESK